MANLKEETILLAEIFTKIVAIERLLVKSGVITTGELDEEMKKISNEITDYFKN